MMRSLPPVLALAILLTTTVALIHPTLAEDEGPTAYKGDEAENFLFEVPIDRYSDSHLNDPPFRPFNPIRGVSINPRPNDVLGGRLEAEVARFIAQGITHFRFGLDWWLMEVGDDQWDLSVTDSLMNIVTNAGGEPLVILGYGSPLHMPPADDCRQAPIYYKLPPKPDHWDAWPRYVDKVATEYGDQIDYYEVWNEQDASGFWYGTVVEFKLMLSKADSVLALRDPTAKIVLGGLAFPLFYDAAWLNTFLDQESYEWFDIIGIHAYSANQHHALSVVEEAFARDPLTPLKDIWVTETGYPSAPVVGDVNTRRAHERSQMDYINRTMSRWRHPSVKAVMWFNGFDRYGDDGEPDKWNMGLIDADGNTKPAFYEWAAWSDPMVGAPLEVSFDLNDENPYQGIYPVEGSLALPDGSPMPPSCVAPDLHFPTHAQEVVFTLDDGSTIKTRKFSGSNYEIGLHFDVDDAWFYGSGETLAVEIEYVSPNQVPLYFGYATSECGDDQTVEYAMNFETKDCVVDTSLPISSTFLRHDCGSEVDMLDTTLPDTSLRRFSAVIDNAGFLNTYAIATDMIVRYQWCDFESNGPVYIKSLRLMKAPRELIVQPAGGEVFYTDQAITLEWETRYQTHIPTVDVRILLDGGSIIDTLASGITNTGEFVWDIGAEYVSQDVTLEVVYHNSWITETISVQSEPFTILRAPEGVFANKSLVDPGDPQSDPIMNYPGRPYASVSFDYDKDGDEDLFITQRGAGPGILYENVNTHPTGAPQMENRRLEAFLSDLPGSDLHGASTVDYDLDGHDDLFVAATPDSGDNRARLYHNNGDGTFTDVAGDLGIAAQLANSWVGVWGDYDGDHWPDLFVGRGGSVPGAPGDDYPVNLMPEPPILLRNRLGESDHQDFDDVSSWMVTGIQLSSNDPGIACIAASWGDLDGDGDQDLVAGSMHPDYMNSGSRLYINNGGVFANEWAQRVGYNQGQVSAVEFGRLKSPAEAVLDLVVGIWEDDFNSPTVYWNDGQGDLGTRTNLDAEFAISSLRVFDYGRDGRLDILALPDQADGSTHSPALFVNYPTLGSLPAFEDKSVEAGLYSIGGAYGATIADFDGDGREDLYLGRETSTAAFFYRAEKQNPSGPPIEFEDPGVLAVLDGNGVFERRGLGASLTLLIAGVPVQRLEPNGGSGRGNQRSSKLMFGLAGSPTENLQVQVTWPDGYVQTSSVDTSGTHEIVYNANPSLQLATVSHQVAFDGPGINEITFSWENQNASSIYLDRVYLTPLGACGDPTVLSYTTPNVTINIVRLPNGNYLHTLVASAQDCTPGCTYSYYCQSATNTQVSNHASNPKTFKTKLCAQ